MSSERTEQVREVEQALQDVRAVFAYWADLTSSKEPLAREAHERLVAHFQDKLLLAKLFAILLVIIFLFILFFL
jgi:hypothetical protein